MILNRMWIAVLKPRITEKYSENAKKLQSAENLKNTQKNNLQPAENLKNAKTGIQ